MVLKNISILLSFMVCFAFAAQAEMKQITKEEAMKIIAQHQEKQITYTNSQKLPTLLVFYAKWCGYCKQLMPNLDRITKEYKGKIFIKKVDVESKEGIELCKTNKTGGSGIPHIQIYTADGSLVRDRLGYQSYDSLKKEIDFVL